MEYFYSIVAMALATLAVYAIVLMVAKRLQTARPCPWFFLGGGIIITALLLGTTPSDQSFHYAAWILLSITFGALIILWLIGKNIVPILNFIARLLRVKNLDLP